MKHAGEEKLTSNCLYRTEKLNKDRSRYQIKLLPSHRSDFLV